MRPDQRVPAHVSTWNREPILEIPLTIHVAHTEPRLGRSATPKYFGPAQPMPNDCIHGQMEHSKLAMTVGIR